jgi:hypothetical protein
MLAKRTGSLPDWQFHASPHVRRMGDEVYGGKQALVLSQIAYASVHDGQHNEMQLGDPRS